MNEGIGFNSPLEHVLSLQITHPEIGQSEGIILIELLKTIGVSDRRRSIV